MTQIDYNFDIVQGNSKEGFDFILKDDAGGRIDITGATLSLSVNNLKKNEFIFNKACSITNAPQGEFSYTPIVDSTDWAKAGTFKGEIKITFSDGRILRKQNLIFNVIPKARTN